MTGPETPEPQGVQPLAREGEHVPPEFKKDAFNCPYCGVLSIQHWSHLLAELPGQSSWSEVSVWMSICFNCTKQAVWAGFGPHVSEIKMIKPLVGGGPRAHVDMPDDVRADYEEAQAIVGSSVRG